MNSETRVPDPYDVVLSDLRAKREQIDQAIKAIEAIRAGQTSAPSASSLPEPQGIGSIGAGAFLGMTIADAARKLLTSHKKPMGNAEIAAGLRQGGMVLSSKTDHQNIVGSVLTRRFQQVGDVVRVDRGVWGLKEWYPNKTFKPSGRTNGDIKPSSNEPEQRFEPVDDDPLA